MSEPKVITADQVEPGLLEDFLHRVFPPLRSAFLNEHGDWWCRSNTNRLVIQLENQIAGYCAVIPTQLWISGQVLSALWWVDLVIAPQFRGRRLQTLFDLRIKEMADILLGGPNPLAAKIHQKHGWGVREDMQILLLPLRPNQVKSVRSAQGLMGMALRIGALVLSPLAALWRARLAAQQPQHVWRMNRFDAEVLSSIFMRAKRDEVNTTWRDEAYFKWRYAAAPQPEEYSYYLAGRPEEPSHYLIARHLTQQGGLRYTRILDVFGDFNDTAALGNLLTLAIQDAIDNESAQVTLLISNLELRFVARRLGFLISSLVRFCWLGSSPEIMSALAGKNYWTLADNDNDEPD